MPQWLTVSRAAHLTGVSRGALQKKIREGELESFDGLVSTAALSRAFPGVDIDRLIDDSGAFEQVTRIKDESFGRRVRERVLPSQELLAQRLFVLGQELAELKRLLARYHALVVNLRTDLAAQSQHEPARAIDAQLAAILASEAPSDLYARMDELLRAVSARVTLRPSGREFLVDGNDSLLEAALKAGLSPSYGCGNGNCGLCRARVIAGDVRRVRTSDYALSETERQQGWILMCTHTALTDVSIEALEANASADIPQQDLVARVRAITPLAADMRLLHLQTPRSNRLRFLAGQGVTLGLVGASGDFAAFYPIASCPCDDRNLHFHIRRDASDAFAERLFAGAVRPGDDINVRGPSGDFVIDHDTERPLVFVAFEHGFAPVKSLIEHAMAAQTCESITLAWVASAGGHYLANQCRAWAEAFDDFRYLPIEAEAGAPAARSLAQALCAASIDLERSDIFAAGPSASLAAIEHMRALPALHFLTV